jgi:hypothetical protein
MDNRKTVFEHSETVNITQCLIQCVRKVAVRLQKLLEVMSTNVYTGLNPFNFIRKHFQQMCIRKVAVHLQSCWKWCPRASVQAWTRLILFANTFCRPAFGKSLNTYKWCWKWFQRANNALLDIATHTPKSTATFRTHCINSNDVYMCYKDSNPYATLLEAHLKQGTMVGIMHDTGDSNASIRLWGLDRYKMWWKKQSSWDNTGLL